jgi:hypothetical protein
MSRTGIRGTQIIDSTIQSIDIEDGSIWREDLNYTSTGKAVVRKIIAGDNVTLEYDGVDSGTGDVTIHATSTGATYHRGRDELVHEIAEDAYCEVERVSGRVSAIYYYEDDSKTTLIRSFEYTRTSGRITQIVAKQYDENGDEIIGEILTGTITRTDGRVSSIEWVRT